jgi:tRNA1(Val) A37 N6-methylase TrmN6
MLKDNERFDDLLTHELKIIQSPEVFSFSLDAVLLARFCSVPIRGAIVDLCSGNGVIPLLLTTRTKSAIVGVELQERLWDMAVRSVEKNGLSAQVSMEHSDLREWAQVGPRNGSFDLVTVNPPYLPIPQGHQNENEHVAIARHEVMCTLEDVVQAASRLVRTGGRVAMVHRPARIVDILELMRKYRLEPKRIRFVHPKPGA